MDDRDPAKIGPRPEQCRVAERQQPEIAIDQVEAERVEAENQDFGGQRGERHHQREYQHHGAGKGGTVQRREFRPADARRFCSRQGLGDLGTGLHLQLINPARPKKPCGRTISTIAISAKIDTLAISGATSDVMLTTTPTSRPASTAPPIDPMPPTTVTTNASARIVPPISGITPCNGAASNPAKPAIAVPIPNTMSHTLATLTPSTRTICGSRAPARMIRPKLVFSRNSHSASSTMAVAPITNSRYSGK